MKKTYEKPVLVRQAMLSAVTASINMSYRVKWYGLSLKLGAALRGGVLRFSAWVHADLTISAIPSCPPRQLLCCPEASRTEAARRRERQRVPTGKESCSRRRTRLYTPRFPRKFGGL